MAVFQNFHRQHSEQVGSHPDTAKFTHGSTMKHVIYSSLASAVGLVALFVVDLVDIYFISILGESELAAAVGFAGTLIFFTMSLSIAGVIAVSATLSKLLGQKKEKEAKQFYVHSIIYSLFLSIPIAILFFIFAPQLLQLVGAEGNTLEYATNYFRIVVASFPVLMVAMSSSAVLRAFGDFKRATYVTLFGGIANAVFDPIFIFALDLGLEGAAIASVLSRFVILSTALYLVLRKYDFWTKDITKESAITDRKAYTGTFVPAALSNLATPIGSGYVVSQMAKFGDGFVAGMSVVGRITPVLFGVILALSGAIGPIIGQNFGAKQYDRVRQTFKDALAFSAIYTVIAVAILFLLQGPLTSIFGLGDDGARIFSFYANFISISFIATAIVFIANATFNNLGHPSYATWINFLRNIVFLIPFVWVGAQIAGPEGILVGQAIGMIVVSVIALIVTYRVMCKLSV